MLLLLLACSGDPKDSAPGAHTDYSQAGPYPTAHTRMELPGGERPLVVEIWYPAAQAGSGGAVPDVFLEGQQATDYGAMMQRPESCATQQTQAGWELSASPDAAPLLVFSHCHQCLRFSSFSVAEQLASHGFVVAAVDHAGNTLWEGLTETGLPLNQDTLTLRVADQERVLAAMQATPPMGIVLDGQVGAYGHSFGSVTSGKFAQENPDVLAALGLAAPMENPLLPGVDMATLDKPVAILLAMEDNSITELGNELIRQNIAAAPGPAFRLDLPDAGHWSVSDLAGLTDSLQPGCGLDERQTDGGDFEYLAPALGMQEAGTFAGAFFGEFLRGEEGAVEAQGYLGELQ